MRVHAAPLPRIETRPTSALDLRPVVATLGILLAILGASMLLPAMVDFSSRSGGHGAFIGSSAVTIFVGVLMWMTGRSDVKQKPDLRQAFLLTGSVWIVLTLFASLPFMWGRSQLSFTDAVFESMSGLTATGATVMSGLDSQPPGILLWRALLNWFGGIGIIAIAIAIMPVLAIGGMQLFRTESTDKSEKFLPRTGAIVKGLLSVYVLLTVACTIGYSMAGMSDFDAITLAMSTVSSGGFSNSDYSIMIFEQPAIEYVAIVFMILSALPFTAYLRAMGGDVTRLFTNPEIKVFFLIIFIFTFATFLQQTWQGIAEGEAAFRGALFTVVAILSTTCFVAVDYTHWGAASDAIFFVLLFFGGCTGSTSGGLKAMRIAITAKAIMQHLKHIRFRSGVFPLRYGGATVSDDIVTSVLNFVFLYIFTILVVAVALNVLGLDSLTALSAAAATVANVGTGLGPVVGPSSNYVNLPDAAMWILTMAMLLGRLEILTALVLLQPRFWMR